MSEKFTFAEAVGAAGRVVQHRDADVLEVLPPLCEALALQAAGPEDQLALEEAGHQVQVVCTEKREREDVDPTSFAALLDPKKLVQSLSVKKIFFNIVIL